MPDYGDYGYTRKVVDPAVQVWICRRSLLENSSSSAHPEYEAGEFKRAALPCPDLSYRREITSRSVAPRSVGSNRHRKHSSGLVRAAAARLTLVDDVVPEPGMT